MEQLKNRLQSILSAVPPAQRVVVLVAIAVLAVTVVIFGRWLTQPSYTLLYSNLDDKALSQVIGELDSQGVPYKIEGGGSQIMVPRQQVYTVRASLAEAGVAGEALPEGYELLDGQGLAVSDFKQRVDYKRALEGEISKTLMAMNGIESASVRLAMPEEQLFSEDQKPVTASVLVGTATTLNQDQVDTVVFLVSSAVEGLNPGNVTVADATGNVLSAPGDAGGAGALGDRNMQLQRQYEAALASDVQRLLTNVTPEAAASVVVHADLNFDETSTESET
ncbi:MAG: flagellar basal-body MS-ring/collar protein FliF, partial [Actinomycetota bacterium]